MIEEPQILFFNHVSLEIVLEGYVMYVLTNFWITAC